MGHACQLSRQSRPPDRHEKGVVAQNEGKAGAEKCPGKGATSALGAEGPAEQSARAIKS